MRFLLRHKTIYRYANPVTLKRHRLMLRPRDSHEMKLHGASLGITPRPSRTTWQYDVFGNSVALVDFATTTRELIIDSTLDVERFPYADIESLVADHARWLPLAYSAEEIRDLAGLQERHVPDPDHDIDIWAKSFLTRPNVGGNGPAETIPLLHAMAATIKNEFRYQARDAYGTQSPLETLHNRSGTCRDFAYLMMEGVRSLGLAARFVSGYIYDFNRDSAAAANRPQDAMRGRDGDFGGTRPQQNVQGPADAPPPIFAASTAITGGGATHAWVQIYLPGAGWTYFDPTNALTSDVELIPVAVVRDPSQASPVSGAWEGTPGDALAIEVDVSITSRTGQ